MGIVISATDAAFTTCTKRQLAYNAHQRKSLFTVDTLAQSFTPDIASLRLLSSVSLPQTGLQTTESRCSHVQTAPVAYAGPTLPPRGSDGLHEQDKANNLSSLTNQERRTKRMSRNDPLSTM